MIEDKSKVMPLSFPKDIVFEYSSESCIPNLASDKKSSLYSGKAHGSNGIADWSGTFVDGVPDGIFRIVLGDRQRGTCEFSKGKQIN